MIFTSAFFMHCMDEKDTLLFFPKYLVVHGFIVYHTKVKRLARELQEVLQNSLEYGVSTNISNWYQLPSHKLT